MNNKRSYLESLNAGRQRRAHSSIEDLNRTFETLAARFESDQQRPEQDVDDDIARRMQRLAGRAAGPQAADSQAEPAGADISFDTLALDMERARTQDVGAAAVGAIAGELNDLREEVRHQITAGLRREFDALRPDIERAYATAAAGAQGAELGLELERLSAAIQTLAERSDDNSVNMLRIEIEQLKNALGLLAREETVRSVGEGWEDFDKRWNESEQRRAASDPALGALEQHLEQINDAMNDLPGSLSLRSLEEKVLALSGAIDRFTRQQEHPAPQVFEMISERLDEISRAIVASSVSASVMSFDPQPFERIEARITSLARQVGELANDRRARQAMDGLMLLTERVDEISRRADLPENAVQELTQQIAEISEKLDAGYAADADRMLQAFETRFADLSAMLERRQTEASEQGQTLFRDLEGRIDEVAGRLDHQNEPAWSGPAFMAAIDNRFAALFGQLETPDDGEAIRSLETRLEDISSRLDLSSRQVGIDADLIRDLEAQVAGLSQHLARPGIPLPDFDDIRPRLDHIEQSIGESRESILSVARRAAEDVIRGLSGSEHDEDVVMGLAGHLKSPDTLARRSDERNIRTFEAIHDTLLKIVDRLSALETSQMERRSHALSDMGLDDAARGKLSLDSTPSIQPDSYETPFDVAVERLPSEAAAAAALAALGSEPDEPALARKRSIFAGITHVLSSRAQAEQPTALARDEVVEGELVLAPEVDLDEPLDPKIANRPLEPGSGAPDLSAIMKRVRDDRAPLSRDSDTDAAKSDFIAAARRAAQAAAAEAEILKKQTDKKSPGSGKFSPGNLFRDRRKTLLMATGAVLIALAGVQMGKAFFADAQRVAFGDAAATEEERLTESTVIDEAVAAEQPLADGELTAQEQPVQSVEIAAEQPLADGELTAQEQPVQSVEIAAAPPQAASAGGVMDAGSAAPGLGAEQAPAAAPAPETMAAPPATAEAPAIEPQPEASPLAIGDIPAEAGPLPLREAAEGGDAKALYEIGARYAEGGGAENLAAAAKWYEISAGLGFAPAQYRIGNFYEKGLGVALDAAKAKIWYQLAAAQGNASAMHNLAVLLAMGAEGAPDNDSAARWFVEAAELGVTDSQFNLGILAAKGVGMPQNLEESYKWFALVAKTGDKDAAAKRDEIAKTLSPEKLEKARAAAELWRARPADPQANIVEIPESWKEGEGRTAAVDVKQAVENIQLILTKNGYDAGGADGVMGQKTKSAIAAFQKEHGLASTGEVNEELVQALLQKR